jgi:NAD(P)-dependent dehydrogenase (short-subunit alcohol dehydrogenase family)
MEGGEAWAIQTDVADERQVERLMADTVARHGRLDILVNNAGIGGGSRVAEAAIYLSTLGKHGVVHQIIIDRAGADW